MKNTIKLSLIGFLFTAGITLAGCGQKEKEMAVVENAPPDTIQLTLKAIQKSGIQALIVQNRSSSSQLITVGEVKANENKVFHISPLVGGRVVRENSLLGDAVGRGQTLAVIQNTEVAKAQASYIHELHQNEIDIQQAKTRLSLAQKNLERERRLLTDGISPRKDYQQAEFEATLAQSELEGQKEHAVHIKSEARALLGTYGVRPASPHSEQITNVSPVTAPRSGLITKKNVTLGDMVTPQTIMYEVADLSQVWLDVTVYPKDLNHVRMGQTVTFTTDSLPKRVFIGRINYISPSVQETSQTYAARAYLDNTAGLLKPGMFGQVNVKQPTRQSQPFVPEAAVQKYGRETFVFIPLDNHRFRKQTVELGSKVSDGYLVNNGLQSGEKVVVQGSFTLKAEMLKSQFAEEQ